MYKYLICFVLTCFFSTLNAYGGFFSYFSPRGKIIYSEGIQVVHDSSKDGAHLAISVSEIGGIMEVTYGLNGENSFKISFPLKYASVTTKEIELDGSVIATAYIIKYGNSQITYANMNGSQCFIIDREQSRIKFIGKKTKFYDDCWNIITQDNGSEFRNAHDIKVYFNGLIKDKDFGFYNINVSPR